MGPVYRLVCDVIAPPHRATEDLRTVEEVVWASPLSLSAYKAVNSIRKKADNGPLHWIPFSTPLWREQPESSRPMSVWFTVHWEDADGASATFVAADHVRDMVANRDVPACCGRSEE